MLLLLLLLFIHPNQAQTCDSNCITCNAGICSACKSGYYLESNQCFVCNIPYCLYCNSNTECRQCRNRHPPIEGKCDQCTKTHCKVCKDYDSPCQVCVSGYTHTTGMNCTICNVSNCISCQLASLCFSCAQGFSLVEARCVPCSINNCQYCQKDNQCERCKNGLILSSNRCVHCNLTNCFICESLTACQICFGGYQRDQNGQCNGLQGSNSSSANNSSTSSTPSWQSLGSVNVLFLIVTIPLALITIGLISGIVYMVCKNKQKFPANLQVNPSASFITTQ